MSAKIYQLRDFQNPKDLERMQRELEKEAAKILESVPFGGQGIDVMNLVPSERFYREYGGQVIDGMSFTAPETDSA